MKKSECSPESQALKAAFKASGLKQAAVAEHMDVTPGAVRQWLEGERPVPATKADRLGTLLSVAPATICAKYAVIAEQRGNVVPLRHDENVDQRRPDQALRRVENDVDALRYALAGIVSVTTVHRPAEALAVAAAIRRSVPKKFLERGFVHELLVTLDAASRA
ncbi:helix-turn-helix transcriptional regulator [Dokdonella soli]